MMSFFPQYILSRNLRLAASYIIVVLIAAPLRVPVRRIQLRDTALPPERLRPPHDRPVHSDGRSTRCRLFRESLPQRYVRHRYFFSFLPPPLLTFSCPVHPQRTVVNKRSLLTRGNPSSWQRWACWRTNLLLICQLFVTNSVANLLKMGGIR